MVNLNQVYAPSSRLMLTGEILTGQEAWRMLTHKPGMYSLARVLFSQNVIKYYHSGVRIMTRESFRQALNRGLAKWIGTEHMEELTHEYYVLCALGTKADWKLPYLVKIRKTVGMVFGITISSAASPHHALTHRGLNPRLFDIEQGEGYDISEFSLNWNTGAWSAVGVIPSGLSPEISEDGVIAELVETLPDMLASVKNVYHPRRISVIEHVPDGIEMIKIGVVRMLNIVRESMADPEWFSKWLIENELNNVSERRTWISRLASALADSPPVGVDIISEMSPHEKQWAENAWAEYSDNNGELVLLGRSAFIGKWATDSARAEELMTMDVPDRIKEMTAAEISHQGYAESPSSFGYMADWRLLLEDDEREELENNFSLIDKYRNMVRVKWQAHHSSSGELLD